MEIKNEDLIKEEESTKAATEVESSDLDQKIIRQVEYYFSDYNLPRDNFLKQQISVDDGWVAVDIMLKFQRLAQLTKNPDAVLGALKKSKSGLMEVCDSSKKIRRSKDKPVPEESEERKLQIKQRTVYCKGFPREGTNIDKILEFFKDYSTVENIKMRYFPDKVTDKSKFKGSVNVTFATREMAENFIKEETVKYNDHPLYRQWSEDWEKEKEEQYLARKSKRDNDGNEKKEDDKDSASVKIVLARGALLKLMKVPEKVDRDEIKKALSNYPADVAHVEITDDRDAIVRLRGENDATVVMSKLEGNKITIEGADLEVSIIEGEEEETYLKKAEENVNNRNAAFKDKRRNGGGRGRGRGRGRGGRGSWRGQKRSGSPNGANHSSKKNKSE